MKQIKFFAAAFSLCIFSSAFAGGIHIEKHPGNMNDDSIELEDIHHTVSDFLDRKGSLESLKKLPLGSEVDFGSNIQGILIEKESDALLFEDKQLNTIEINEAEFSAKN